VGHPGQIDQDLQSAALDQRVNLASERQVAIIEQHLTAQHEHSYVVDVTLFDLQL
jgi:hypothetical protein